MNFTGILFGLFAALVIGGGFIWVIKLEYYVGAHLAKPVAAVGVLVILLSLIMPNFVSSALLGVVGGSIVWGATEFPDQQDRVEKGIFPANPNKRTRQAIGIKKEEEGQR
jgi:hypothetical protein